MKDNLAAIRADLLPAQDLIVREFVLGWTGAPRAGLLYLDGLADTDFLQRDVLKPLTLSGDRLAENQLRGRGDLLGQLEEKLLPIAQVRRSSDRRELRQAILEGDGALLIEGCSQGLILGVRGYDTRAISEPTTEGVVRGPRDGFTEEIKTNLSLIRRRLPSRQLAVEFLQLGDYTRTRVALVYMKELARPGLVEEVRRRLAAIRIAGGGGPPASGRHQNRWDPGKWIH
ncbi:MAG: spore germination protein [Firmicutes bacterium]|nr:spore germination protein [Bacillota bacterium]